LQDQDKGHYQNFEWVAWRLIPNAFQDDTNRDTSEKRRQT
jgi:hypothetical protein